MRWATAGVALVVFAVMFATITAAAPGDPPRVHDGKQSSAPSVPSTVRSFRSVRSYVAVAEPIRLRIAAGGVDTLLQQLGRAPDGSIQVPTNFALAGWFAEGVRPGQPGPAVILGHVDSRSGPAVFYRLARLAVGADVLVDRADGSTIGFRVSRVLRVPKADFPVDLVYAPTLEPSLRLVTCGGSFDRARRSYVDNVIVYADPPS
jgi:Sortase domain